MQVLRISSKVLQMPHQKFKISIAYIYQAENVQGFQTLQCAFIGYVIFKFAKQDLLSAILCRFGLGCQSPFHSLRLTALRPVAASG